MNPKVIIFAIIILLVSGFFVFKSQAAEIPLPFAQQLATSSIIPIPTVEKGARISAFEAYRLIGLNLNSWDPNALLIQVKPSDLRPQSLKDFDLEDGLTSEWLFYFSSEDGKENSRYKVNTLSQQIEIIAGNISLPDYASPIQISRWKLDSNRLLALANQNGFPQWQEVHPGYQITSTQVELVSRTDTPYWHLTAHHDRGTFELQITADKGKILPPDTH